MSAPALLALVLAAVSSGKEPLRPTRLAVASAPKPTGKTAGSTSGTVTYQTKQRAFLNRGEAEGLAVGMVLHLSHDGRAGGQCKVDSVATHAATCSGSAIHPGDTFKTTATPPTPPAPAPLPPVLPWNETLRRQSALFAHALELVEFNLAHGSTPLNLGGPVTVTLGHELWTSFAKSDTGYQAERLDISVQGADLTHGLRLYIDATAMSWTQAPVGAIGAAGARLPYSSPAVLLVRQTEVDHRVLGDSWVASVGRILPANAPGATVLDGLQGGWRSTSGSLEFGGYAGLVPDPISLAPATNRWTIGGYGGYRYVGEKTDALQLFQESFRVAAVFAPEVGTRLEVETAAQAWFPRSTSLAGDVRFGIGQLNSPALLEAARFDFDTQPTADFRLGTSVRYLNAPTSDALLMGMSSLARNGTHFDLTASWNALPWLGVSGIFGIADDANSGLAHGEVGPELSLPRLFGDRGGVAVGYLQEFGWWGQRTAYVQAMVQPFDRLRLQARGLYLEDTPASGAGDFNARELGLSGDATVRLTSFLMFHLGALLRQGVGSDTVGGDTALRNLSSTGVNLSAALTGTL